MASSASITATLCATLVDEWLACGVKHAVVSPGSRSTPMALAIAGREEIAMHLFHDERSAAFCALGIAKATGVPAIVLCTSGTAATEFFPAVTEASYAEVPMLVCTADRPPELQGVGAPQTIDQQNLYGAKVLDFVNIEVADDAEKDSWRSIARRVFEISVGAGADQKSGPIHVNLQFREPLVGVAEDLPRQIDDASFEIARKIQKLSPRKLRKFGKALTATRGLIIAGPENYDGKNLLKLAEHLGWPIFADPRGAARVSHELVIGAFDSILRSQDFSAENKPEVVLRIGTPPASKVTNQWLAGLDCRHLVLTTTPTLVDPEKVTDHHIVADIDETLTAIQTTLSRGLIRDWSQRWSAAESAAQAAINQALRDEPAMSEPALARTICASLPDSSTLVVSSSMPIRDVEWFSAPRAGLKVLANRGVNGIDGVVSTAVGVALASKSPTCLLIGDVALLHDTNGLLNLAEREADLKIVVIDNSGGGIFSFLPQASSLETSLFEKVFGTPHNVDIEMLAKAHRVGAQTVQNLDDLTDALAQRGPVLVRVCTDRNENVKVHDRVNQAVAAALREAR